MSEEVPHSGDGSGRSIAGGRVQESFQAVPALTIAVRVCATCKTFLGVNEWKDEDAHDGVPWIVTHGLCDPCLEKF